MVLPTAAGFLVVVQGQRQVEVEAASVVAVVSQRGQRPAQVQTAEHPREHVAAPHANNSNSAKVVTASSSSRAVVQVDVITIRGVRRSVRCSRSAAAVAVEEVVVAEVEGYCRYSSAQELVLESDSV